MVEPASPGGRAGLLGAKKGPDTRGLRAITDPESLLTWLGTDRATVTFRVLGDVTAKRVAFLGTPVRA